MASLDQIVDIQIDRKTAVVSRASFGIPLLLGKTQRSANKVNAFTDMDAVAEVYASTDPEYLAASAMFSQNPKPPKLWIGTREATTVLTPTATNSTVYKVKVNGQEASYTSDSSATVAEICAGLTTAINGLANAAQFTATDNTTNVSIVSDTDNGVIRVESTGAGTIALTYTVTDTIADAMTNIRANTDEFYVVLMTSRSDADILAMAAVIEPLTKLFCYQSSASDIKASGTSDTASTLKTSAYNRTFGIWHDDDSEYVDCAWVGKTFTKDPGSLTFVHMQLNGVPVDVLTAAEQTNLDTKRVSYFVTTAGINATQGGKVASGEWIDVMRDVDWLQVNMKADVFELMAQEDKIPFTDGGIAQVESKARARVQQAERNGILVSGSVVWTIPKASEISSSDKAARKLTGIKFDGKLQGAAHFVSIRGTVSV